MNNTDNNPYAAPSAAIATAVPFPSSDVAHITEDFLAEARRRLDEYLSQPHLVANDERVIEPRIRREAWGRMGVAAILVAVYIVAALRANSSFVSFGAVFLSVQFVLFLLWRIYCEYKVQLRHLTTTPSAFIASWLHALKQGRCGYAWACLGPVARQQDIATPELHPFATDPGIFNMHHIKTLEAWLRAFSVSGSGHRRFLKVIRVDELSRSNDVAVVSATVRFQSWSQWAFSVLLFCLVGVAVGATEIMWRNSQWIFLVSTVCLVVGPILFYSLRRRITVRVTKTMLLGRDGRWYLADARLSDGAIERV